MNANQTYALAHSTISNFVELAKAEKREGVSVEGALETKQFIQDTTTELDQLLLLVEMA